MSETAPASSPVEPDTVRPLVRTASANRLVPWLFGAALVAGGLLLFNALSANRQAQIAATGLPSGGDTGGMISAPPPLALPPAYFDPRYDDYAGNGYPRLVRRERLPGQDTVTNPEPRVVTRVIERPVPMPATSEPAPFVQRPALPVVITNPSIAPSQVVASDSERERVTAGRLANPSLTVQQGTVIAAVLETALDSTRAGAVRAIVSRDVRSFDGSRVLIPRGSRLYGEYTSDLSAGQKRALVQWHRLTRPDAVIIDLDSPAADPLGRSGIRGKVDSNFLARYGGAILQSVLDIGVGLATRSVLEDEAVILALPGSTQQVTGQAQPSDVQRTLRVQQGTSVSVFVARDLDFSTVER